MGQSLVYPLIRSVIKLCLVHSITHNEGMLNADTNDQEGQPRVEGRGVEPAVVEQTESCGEGEGHRGNCCRSHDASAVNWTEGAEEHGNVNTDYDCCHNNVRYILLDSVSPGLDVAILCKEEKGRSFCSLGPFIDGQLEVFFEAKVCVFVYLTVSGLINVVRILGNFCLF